jgi:hypothetical protein
MDFVNEVRLPDADKVPNWDGTVGMPYEDAMKTGRVRAG